MKANTTFIFAGIMSAIIGNAYATGENTVTSKSYVDAQDALKQDLITTSMVTISDGDGKNTYNLPALVSYDNTDELTGTKYGILHDPSMYAAVLESEKSSEIIPTVGWMEDRLDSFQLKISSNNSSFYPDGSIVTYGASAGYPGAVGIYNGTAANYNSSTQSTYIPTMGAMMSAISSGVSAAAPTGTANTIANYGANGALDSGIAMYTGAAAYNSTNDSAKIPTMAGVATYAQAKKTCAGWPDGTTTYDATHTDANCWLWTLPD